MLPAADSYWVARRSAVRNRRLSQIYQLERAAGCGITGARRKNKCPSSSCAVGRRDHPVGDRPTRQLSLQPVAIGAVVEEVWPRWPRWPRDRRGPESDPEPTRRPEAGHARAGHVRSETIFLAQFRFSQSGWRSSNLPLTRSTISASESSPAARSSPTRRRASSKDQNVIELNGTPILYRLQLWARPAKIDLSVAPR
jgi:hypothetical protein